MTTESGKQRVLSTRLGPAMDQCEVVTYDPASNQTRVRPLQFQDVPEKGLEVTSRVVRPSAEELRLARRILEKSPGVGPSIRKGLYTVSTAMPGATVEQGRRWVHVYLRGTPEGRAARVADQILLVDVADGTVLPATTDAAKVAFETLATCGPPDALQSSTGSSGSALVTVSRGGAELWRFTVIEPNISSGVDGSGVELVDVYYKGKKVLNRAGVPVINVKYEPGGCGTFRDWLNEESKFTCNGIDNPAGIRRCTEKPVNMADNGVDAGNFNGVAIWDSGSGTATVESELEAGWYRYVVQWKFTTDGILKPRFYFAAVADSCVCHEHTHHAYWRFDFAVINNANNGVQELRDTDFDGLPDTWVNLTTEYVMTRGSNPYGTDLYWNVFNTLGPGYVQIRPDLNNFADSFAVADQWALLYKANEIDDSTSPITYPNSDKARIDGFRNGENIFSKDVVVWYRAGFHHVTTDVEAGHVVGPDLVLFGY